MKKYQNVAFNSDKASFIDVEAQRPTQATFAASAVKASVTGGQVPMVRGSVRLAQETETTVCGKECAVTVVESVELKFSVLAGAEHLSALRAEVNRLFDDAMADYALNQGLVPPVYATFADQ